jgi:YD repeat-containing protein
VNIIASVAALGLIHWYGWFGSARLTQILMAGVSAMAFFRTSLFVVRAGDRDVGVGPSGFL